MTTSEVLPELPAGLEDAFGSVAGELGQASASRLFIRAVARCEGEAGVAALLEKVGPSYPVLDGVARAWLDGQKEPPNNVDAVLEVLKDITRLVIVGVEADFLDAFLAKVDEKIQIALVAHSPFEVDWERVLDNFRGRVDRVDLDTFQKWAGRKSVLMTFAYGRHGTRTNVLPLWLRACGADVRSQFRSLVAVDVLGRSLELFPRWLVEIEIDQFSHFIR